MMTSVLLAAAPAAEGGGKASNNFLLPNATILVELLIFVIVFAVFAKFKIGRAHV